MRFFILSLSFMLVFSAKAQDATQLPAKTVNALESEIAIPAPEIPVIAESQKMAEKEITVEWESLPGAQSYDLELTKIQSEEGGIPVLYQSTKAQWTGYLAPGSYYMRIRARDKRKVPGQWSPREEIKIGLDQVKLLEPAENESKKSSDHKEELVTFKWSEVAGTTEYQFEISSEDHSFTLGLVVSETQTSLKLPVAQKYIWKVQAKGYESESNETPSIGKFTLLGKKLDPPKINEINTLGGVIWEKPEHAESIDYVFLKQNPKTGKWETQQVVKDSQAEGLEFAPEMVGGQYALVLRAKAPLRETSDRAESKFQITDHNLKRRTASINALAAKNETESERDKLKGAYIFVQQMASQMDYESTNTDDNEKAQFSGVGGSFRIGAGYYWTDRFAGEFVSESGGIFEDVSRYAFNSQEINYIERYFNDGDEVREYFGLYSRELPMVSATGSNPYEIDSASVGGLHYGVEKNFDFKSKWGLQFHFHPYLNLFRIRTPNGADIVPTLSGRTGLLGTYKFSSALKGYGGYTYRVEQVQYRAGGSNHRDNAVEMEGHFLNFYLEWDL